MYQVVTARWGLPITAPMTLKSAKSFMRWLTIPGEARIEALPLDGDHAAAVEQDTYESCIVAEARAIASAGADQHATAEHLRVLLAWLDGSPADGYQPPTQFDEDLPF